MRAATPGIPNTLATSWGSAATAVVPSGSTVRTNSSIQSLVDSRCIWASTRPAVTAAPSRSTTSAASRGPHPATTPSAMARSVVTHSRVEGDSTRPPRSSRSAGSSPRATARTWGEDGARAMAHGGPAGLRRQTAFGRGDPRGAWEDRSMLTLRPMTDADVDGAVEAFDSGFLAMRARYGLPVTASSMQNERRRQNRTRHFLGTDPGGSWVADDEGTIVGMSQATVREGYWCSRSSAPFPVARAGAWVASCCGWPSRTATRRARAPSSAPAIPRPWRSTRISASRCIRWWPPGATCARAR